MLAFKFLLLTLSQVGCIGHIWVPFYSFPRTMPFAHTSTLTSPPVLGRLLLRSHQADLGHVAIHGPPPRESWKAGKRNVPIGVDPSLLFSWAQPMVALNKIGFLLAREDRGWLLGTQVLVLATDMYSQSLSFSHTPHHTRR